MQKAFRFLCFHCKMFDLHIFCVGLLDSYFSDESSFQWLAARIVYCSMQLSCQQTHFFFNIVCNVYVRRFQNRFRSSYQIMGSYHGPNCPRCNDNAHGCQNLFSSKMRFTGATFGAMNGFGRAIQFQKMNTQHFSNAFIHEWCSVIFEVMNFRGVGKKNACMVL